VRTIGSLYFDDTTVSNAWILANNSNAANILTLDNGANKPVISVGIGTASQSVMASSGTAATTGSVNLDVYGSGVAVTTGTHNLVTAAGGLDGATYTPRILNSTNFTATNLVVSPTSVSMDFTSASALTTEYWKGGLSGGSGVWALSNGSTASNWTSDLAGTANTSLTPGAGADVFFSSTGATNLTGMSLGSNMSVKSISVSETSPLTLNADGNTLTIAGAAGITVNSGAGAVTLNAPITLGAAQSSTNNSSSLLTIGGAVSNGGVLLTVAGTGNTTIAGNLGGIGTHNGGLTKTGAGTLNLQGVSSYTGATIVSGGTLDVSGGITGNGALTVNGSRFISSGTSHVGVINVASTASTGNAVLSITGGELNSTLTGSTGAFDASVNVGTATGSVGEMKVSGGNVNISRQLLLGNAGGFGGYTQTAGNTSIGGFLAMGLSATAGTVGIFNQSGGTFTQTVGPATIGAGSGGTGVITLSGTAAYTNSGFAGSEVWIAEGGKGVLNVMGSATFTHSNSNLIIGKNNAAASNGQVNLLGGTITVAGISKSGAAATGSFNFNGGTLKASQSNGTFMAGLSSSYVNSGGGTIDNAGNAITVGQALLAPTSGGVSSIAVTGGTGYIETPLVTFTGGGGSGAAAIANIDSNGNITGITITNPGVGYTSAPTVALLGGGGSGAAIGTVSTAANVSGGMTFTGTSAGITTLTGPSTYSGSVSITGGTKVIANLGNNVFNPTNSALGNNQVVRNITLSGGSTLQFNSGDTMGSADSTIASALVIGAGSTVTNGGGVFNRLGSVNLNGGTLNAVSGAVAGYQAYSFGTTAVVTVGGGTVSTISSAGANGGIHLNTNTSFVVADATSSAASDLNVSAPLINRNLTEGGTGGLTKSGAGTMTLTGVSTYSGATTISNGTLVLGSGGSIANSTTIDVQSGATLDASVQGGWALATGQTLKGNGTVDVGGSNTFTVGGGASLAPGASPGTLGVTGTLSFAALSTFSAEIAPSTPVSDLVNVSGGLNVNATASLALSLFGTDTALAEGTKFTLIDYSGSWNNVAFAGFADDSSTVLGLNTYMVDYNDPALGGTAFTLTVIPEPTTATLIGGLGVLGLLRRRRNA